VTIDQVVQIFPSDSQSYPWVFGGVLEESHISTCNEYPVGMMDALEATDIPTSVA
jgi:hypothetical protein